MTINKTKRIKLQELISELENNYSIDLIEKILIDDFLRTIKVDKQILDFQPINVDNSYVGHITTIEELEYSFELLVPNEEKNSNGVVFTPEYIVNEIIDNIITSNNIIDKKILDPACGTGAFLRGALLKIKKITNLPYKTIIEKYLYGIDINPDNIRRVKIILTLECLIASEDYENINFNLFVCNSLKEDLNSICKLTTGFDYIIGNPPYVNPHDLDIEIIKLMKSKFKTTKKGTSNIFYAFIEHSMEYLDDNGILGFIVPNNFLKIQAAEELRKFIKENNYLDKIIDFTDNLIFAPIRTYNALLYLRKRSELENTFEYSVIKRTNDIPNALQHKTLIEMNLSNLDNKMWNLLSKDVLENIRKIEYAGRSIQKLIRTGIATLKDEVYILDGYDEEHEMYFKYVDNEMFFIEPDLVKSFFKVSDIKQEKNILDSEKFIIFPYELYNGKYKIISQERLLDFPLTYTYLVHRRDELMSRSSHKKGSKLKWFEYGRSQGLNKFGSKLLFPTFSNEPKFTLIENPDVLFANGYAVFDDDILSIDVIQKILNSYIMKYYVNNTSYSIEGGYYCYQKKYIQDFSIPHFSEKEIEILKTESLNNINEMLINKYNLIF